MLSKSQASEVGDTRYTDPPSQKISVSTDEVIIIFQVSLDSQVRESLNRAKDHPTRDTFYEAQLQIYTLMQRDSYPRFVNSQMYKQLTKV